MTDTNVFAPPKADEPNQHSLSPNGDDQVADIRRQHLNTEASVKSVGSICILFGALYSISILTALTSHGGGFGPAAAAFAISGSLLTIGICIRRLLPVGRILYSVGFILIAALALIPTAAFGAPALIAAAIGLLIPGLMLGALWTSKARTVFSSDYRTRIIPETPHIRYRTPVYIWVILGLIVLLIIGAMVM